MSVKSKSDPFSSPIRPGKVVRLKSLPAKNWKGNIGQRFRIGYYSRRNRLDCIWLVNDFGEYEQTVDHEYLYKFFEMETVTKERSLYGKNRPPFGPLS